MGDRIKFINIGNKSLNVYDIVSHYIENDSYVIDMLADKHIFNRPNDIADLESTKTEVSSVLLEIEENQFDNELRMIELAEERNELMTTSNDNQTALNDLVTAGNEILTAGNETNAETSGYVKRIADGMFPEVEPPVDPEAPEEP